MLNILGIIRDSSIRYGCCYEQVANANDFIRLTCMEMSIQSGKKHFDEKFVIVFGN